MPDHARTDSLRQRIEALGDWFHNMDLGGVQTAPDHFLGDYPAFQWERLRPALPADLTGMRVLDIGCNAGFFSIQMKQLGADQVVAVDHDPRYLAQAKLAAEVHDLDISFRQLSVYDIGQLGARFDIVLFMGVLYHLRHPLLALDLIHEHVADDLLVMQSMERGGTASGTVEGSPPEVAEDYDFRVLDVFDQPDFPRMHFIEHRYCGDPTNWWLPNRACAEAMLRSAGFDILARPAAEITLCRRR
ncbi:methyltransferase, TIGR04290 family protein [Tistrella bauzanensis]|uniref:Methyltransferase, TIGR04290 family protein n=1 Tax=Tistrella bauzanensis TaxID=657419 RepID=A0ABQ1IBB4_9PROT|nr:TIGR04290 family methyltransferase [Tistrella bauzanensis]GGB27527.1 methyltransferase, TIGR04290 family protein [Tistrella bauzanensis]